MKSGKFSTFNRCALKAALVSTVVLGGTGLVSNAYAATTSGATSATVLVPIAVQNNTTLAFGKFTNVANTIAVTPAAGRTASAPNSLLTGSPAVAGQVTVTGDPSATYSIVLTPAALTKGGDTMTLSLMTAADSGATGVLITTGTIGGGGTQALKIGGTLTVGAAQAAGAYTGTYDVTVEYN